MDAFLAKLRRYAGVLITLIPAAVGLMLLHLFSPMGAFGWWTGFGSIAAVVALSIGFPFTGLVEYFTTDPNRNRSVLLDYPDAQERIKRFEYPPDTRGLFTKLLPGQEKIIIAPGGAPVKIIMNHPGYIHRGERPGADLEHDPRSYWRVLPRERSDPPAHPIPFPVLTGRTWYRVLFLGVNLLWWAWKHYIYWFKGVVWVGPSWFRQVRTYRMPRMSARRIGSANETDKSSIEIDEQYDYSDHYRTEDFQIAVLLPNVNCKNMIAVRIVIVFNGRVANSYRAAFGTDDRWSLRLAGAIANAVRIFASYHLASEVIAAKDGGSASDLAKFVARIGYDENDDDELPLPDKTKLREAMGEFASDRSATAFGIITARTPEGEFLSPDIIDVSTIDDADAKTLAAPAFAQAQMEADLLDAKGKAAYIDEEGAAIERHKESGALIATLRAQVDTATAATQQPGAIVMVHTGGQQGQGATDPVQLAILNELRRNAGGNTGGTP